MIYVVCYVVPDVEDIFPCSRRAVTQSKHQDLVGDSRTRTARGFSFLLYLIKQTQICQGVGLGSNLRPQNSLHNPDWKAVAFHLSFKLWIFFSSLENQLALLSLGSVLLLFLCTCTDSQILRRSQVLARCSPQTADRRRRKSHPVDEEEKETVSISLHVK